MKKFLIILILLSFLTGCSYSKNYIDPEERCIVTSVGVKRYRDDVICIVEATDIDVAKLYKGNGNSLNTAIKNALMKISGEIIFSQCPLILIDDSVDKNVLEQIFELCVSEYDFSLSIQLINCDVSKIYDRKTPENSHGYEIIKTVNHTENSNKITQYGRFASIYNDNNKSSKFYLPHLVISDDALKIDGLSVYKNCEKNNFLDIKVVENESSRYRY